MPPPRIDFAPPMDSVFFLFGAMVLGCLFFLIAFCAGSRTAEKVCAIIGGVLLVVPNLIIAFALVGIRIF